MKHLFLLLILSVAIACSPKLQKDPAPCFRGKLVKKGACGQRVIQLMSAPAELVKMARQWTDSSAHKKYQDVFTVSNACDFPATIAEGEEFSFMITTKAASNCIQCFVYTATPKEKNAVVIGCPK